MASYADNSWNASLRVTAPADADVVERINRWFAQHGVAWAGTPSELSRLVGRASEELMHALEAASVTLLIYGISASVLRRPGQPTIISLRRLQEIENPADIVANRRKPPGSEYAVEGTLGHPYSAMFVDNNSAIENQPLAEKLEANERKLPANESAAQLHENAPVKELDVNEPAAHSAEALPASESADPAGLEPLPLATFSVASDAPRPRRTRLWWAIGVGAVVAALLIGLRYRAIVNQSSNGSPSQQSGFLQESDPAGNRLDVAPEKASPESADRPKMPGSAEINGLYRRAQQNNPDAEYELALRFLRGEGQPRNEAEAATWFERAARMGDARAQFQLGEAYSSGTGVPQDLVTGYTWMTLASANGDTAADAAVRGLTPKLTGPEIAMVRWKLAEMYKDGVGTRANKSAAYVWYSLAEAAGDKRGTVAKNELASTMTPEQVSNANAAALSWMKKHRM
jgi:TPR repeat protein